MGVGNGRSFAEQVMAATPGGEALALCMQCGTCGGSCPSGPDMDYTPRMLFTMVKAGMKDEVLKSNTPWYCVSCYYCTVRCPQQLPITAIMYTLKQMSVEAGIYRDTIGPRWSKTFINLVERYGRSFEVGVVTLHYLDKPLKLAQMGMGMGMNMVLKGRMGFAPDSIKNIDQLQAILKRAKQISAGG